MSELPTRSAPVAAARSTAMVKSAMTRTMPRSALFGLRDIADSPPRLEVGERAVADGDLRLGDRGDGCRQARVRAVEVAEVEAAGGDVVDDRDGQRGAVGAADLAAEHVVDHVLARPREQAVAVQVLLEVDLARRGLDEALLDAGAVGRLRGRERAGYRWVEGRHAELARHQVDRRAGDGLALRVRALRGVRLLLSLQEGVERADGQQRQRHADEDLGGREARAPGTAGGRHEQGIVLQRT